MTLSGPKNQSILLRIAPTKRHLAFVKKNKEYQEKQTYLESKMDF